MIERHRRLVLLIVASALATSILVKGRTVSLTGDLAAFLPVWREQPGTKTIRIRGDAISPGIYQVADAKEFASVTNMTVASVGSTIRINGLVVEGVHSGDIVTLFRKDRKYAVKSIENMAVIEKMLLGIPLDPNRMSSADWESLPGVGAVTADRIVVDRQINGEFSSVRDLKRVPGIGEARLKQVERYFGYDIMY